MIRDDYSIERGLKLYICYYIKGRKGFPFCLIFVLPDKYITVEH